MAFDQCVFFLFYKKTHCAILSLEKMKHLYQEKKYKHFNKTKVSKQAKTSLREAISAYNKKMHPKTRSNEIPSDYCIKRFPRDLYLRDESEELFEIINSVQNKSSVWFNFSNVKNISVGSALYIKAYIDSHKKKQKIRISCSPKNEKMREILQHMQLKNYDLKIKHKDISCWTFREWTKNKPENYGRILMEEIFPKILKDRITSEKFSEIASGLHEVIANCAEHAYLDTDEFTGYYFIAGEYENRDGKSNKFTFCIIDMGQGFRASLRKNSLFSGVYNKLRLETDEYLIKAAVDGLFNADSDDKSGRGTGLPAVKENVQSIGGTLNISSGCGCFSFDTNERLFHRKNATIGSIITVNLPIK